MPTKFVLIILTFCTVVSSSFAQWPLSDTAELSIRDGLPNFFHKVETKDSLRICFIGGSLTATAPGWVSRTLSWMESRYPENKIIGVNAGYGGTTSKYRAFEIEGYLEALDDFDLIFIEYAVNDNKAISSDVEKSIESIIHKIWKKNAKTDICMVYAIRENFLADLEQGKMNLSASKHDSIASYYGVPSVFWGNKCLELIQRDSIVFYDTITNLSKSTNKDGQLVFTSDQVHPSAFGYQVYADVLQNCFSQIEHVSTPFSHQIKTPIVPYNKYVEAKMLVPDKKASTNFSYIYEKGEVDYIDEFLVRNEPLFIGVDSSATYSFRFKGSEIGVDIVVGPSVGRFSFEIDGVMHNFTAFDPYCDHYRRQSSFVRLKDTIHDVTIKVDPNGLNLTEKRELLLGEFRKKILDNDPTLFSKNELILAHIFVAGYLANDSVPIAPCDFSGNNISILQNEIWLDTDCDGDGVTNGIENLDGTDPKNPCDYTTASNNLAPSTAWLALDCDGDGIKNGYEIANGTDPKKPNKPTHILEHDYEPSFVGLTKIEKNGKFHLNRTENLICISSQLDQAFSWVLLDIQGQIRIQGIQNQSCFQLPQQGVYFLKLSSDGGQVTYKLSR